MEEYDIKNNSTTNQGPSPLKEKEYVEENRIHILPSIYNEKLPISFKLVFLLMGLLGFELIGLIFGLILTRLDIDKQLLNTLIQFVPSLIVFIIFITMLSVFKEGFFIKHFFRSFKYKKIYIWGFIFVALALLIETVLSLLITPIQKNLSLPSVNENERLVRELIAGGYGFINFLSISIIGPFNEEIEYRLGTIDLIGRKNRIKGLIIASLIFALIHFQGLTILLEMFNKYLDPESISQTFEELGALLINEFLSIPIYFGMGLFLGLAYITTGEISTSIIAHITNNTLSFFMVIISNYVVISSPIYDFFLKIASMNINHTIF